MTWYHFLKQMHILFAVISITGFAVRGIWMLQTSPMLNRPWVRITPHTNDTLLLVTAVLLMITTGLYPGTAIWINAKLLALIIYIVLGTIALRRGKTRTIRITAFTGALLIFMYIVLVALTKDPFPVI